MENFTLLAANCSQAKQMHIAQYIGIAYHFHNSTTTTTTIPKQTTNISSSSNNIVRLNEITSLIAKDPQWKMDKQLSQYGLCCANCPQAQRMDITNKIVQHCQNNFVKFNQGDLFFDCVHIGIAYYVVNSVDPVVVVGVKSRDE